ncbi:MAG: cob(I)yrinic acid a,c-diamide adenosyltransferase [Pseudomonadota bacterium]
MGHRLSKIYTRTGDAGTTGLGDGSRVDKDDPRVAAYGTVDEANSVIGMVIAQLSDPAVVACLTDVQHDLFEIGGELSLPGYEAITEDHVLRLEQQLDAFNESLPALKEFVLPGGGMPAATCHLARTVVRRAERAAVSLGRDIDVSAVSLRYLNRLSDLLFVIARRLARASGHGEQLWQRDR